MRQARAAENSQYYAHAAIEETKSRIHESMFLQEDAARQGGAMALGGTAHVPGIVPHRPVSARTPRYCTERDKERESERERGRQAEREKERGIGRGRQRERVRERARARGREARVPRVGAHSEGPYNLNKSRVWF